MTTEADQTRLPPSAAPVPTARVPSLTQTALAPLLSRCAHAISLATENALDHRRAFVLLPFCIILGMAVYAAAPDEPGIELLGLSGLLLGAALPFTRRSRGRATALLFALALWAGAVLLPVHGALHGTPMLDRELYGNFTARVDAVLSEDGEGRRFVASHLVAEGSVPAFEVRRARIFAPAGTRLSAGDLIAVRLRLYPVPGPVVPGGHDAQFSSYFDGIGAYGAAIGPVTVTGSEPGFSLFGVVEGVRRDIADRVSAVLSGPEQGIAIALVNGDQSRITEEQRLPYMASGLAHIYSISGLHLSLVAGGVFALLRSGMALAHGPAQRWPIKKLAAFAGIIAALGYLLLSGSGVAAFRSTVMIVLIFGAIIAGRQALTMRNVAIAALLVLASDPASVFRPSFQLSFAAVVALIAAFESLKSRSAQRRSVGGRFARMLGGTVLSSLVAGVATALFAAYHFQYTAPLGVVANLLALPLVGLVVMPMAVLSVLLMPLGLEAVPLQLMGVGIRAMTSVAELVAGWSHGFNAGPILSPSALLIGLAALAWLAFYPTRLRLLGPIAAVPLVLAFAVDRAPDVLVADTTQAVAVRGASGLALIAGKPDSFAVDVWSERYRAAIAAAETGVLCDGLGCIATSPRGFSLALVKDPSAFAEDCGSVALVVTRLRAPASCRSATTVVDRGDLARGGVHWLRWTGSEQGWDIRRAITASGRPWRAARP